MSPDELQDFRVQRLQALLEKKFGGKKVELGRALGHKSGAFVRQLVERERPITEKTVQAVERLPGCSGWFDSDAAPMAAADPSEGPVDEAVLEALGVIRAALARATGAASALAGDALRLLALTPDSDRAFSNAADVLLAKYPPRAASVDEQTATEADWRDLRKRAMRIAETDKSPAKRAAAAKLMVQLDQTMREDAATSKPRKTRHEG